MSLVKEVSKRVKEIDRTSSEKDRIFYNYLTGKPIEVPDNSNPLDVIKISYSAFTKKYNEKQLVETMQKTQPLKGLHYTSNFFELIAIALHDFEGERNNLQNYIDSHNAKEVYIINKLFPEIKYKTPIKVETNIDKLVNDVLIENNLSQGEEKILDALKDANDLLDVYVIEQALKVFYKLHPSTTDKKNIKYLLTFYLKLHKILYMLLSTTFYVVLIGVLVYGTIWVTPYIVSNWNIIEPYEFIIGTVVQIIIMLLFTALGWKLNIKQLIKPAQEKLVHLMESFIFNIIGINLTKILEIQSSYQDK